MDTEQTESCRSVLRRAARELPLRWTIGIRSVPLQTATRLVANGYLCRRARPLPAVLRSSKSSATRKHAYTYLYWNIGSRPFSLTAIFLSQPHRPSFTLTATGPANFGRMTDRQSGSSIAAADSGARTPQLAQSCSKSARQPHQTAIPHQKDTCGLPGMV